MEVPKQKVEVYLHLNDIPPQYQGVREFPSNGRPQMGEFITLNEQMPEGPGNVAKVLGTWHDSRRPPRIYVVATLKVFEEFKQLIEPQGKKG